MKRVLLAILLLVGGGGALAAALSSPMARAGLSSGGIGIGILAEVLFLSYVFVVGRNAAARGHTGDIGAELLEDQLATQA